MKTKKILKKVQACFLSAALICACLAAIPMQAFAAEDPPISLDQNFDNDFQPPTEALGAAKSTGAWYLQGSTNSVKVEVADVTDTNTVDNGGGSGKAVKFTNKSGDTNNQGIAYLFRNSSSTKLTTGKFRISGSIYATGRNPFVLELLGINGSSFQNVEVLKTGYSNLMTWDNDTDKVVYGLGTEVHCGDLFPLLKDFTPNTWYDYSIILDLDQDPAVYHVTLSHDGRAIAQIRDRKLLSGGTGSTITDNFISF